MKHQLIPVTLMILILGIMSACSPTEQARATIAVMQVQPTATAAAIANNAAAIRATIVAPVEAQLEAQRKQFEQAQTLSEEQLQQALQHQGEMAQLTLSNTQALDRQAEAHAVEMNQIAALGAKDLANVQAAIDERHGQVVQSLNWNLTASLALFILLAGGASAVVIYLRTRAHIFHDQNGEMIIVRGNLVVMPGRTAGPVLAVYRPGLIERLVAAIMLLSGKQPPPVQSPVVYPALPADSPAQMEVVARQQAIGFIRAALSGGKDKPVADQIKTSAVSVAQSLLKNSSPDRPEIRSIQTTDVQLLERLWDK